MESLGSVILRSLKILWRGLKRLMLGDIKMALLQSILWVVSKSLYVMTAILLMFAPIGTLEVFNHLRGGDALRPWILTETELSRLKIKELELQGCEQDFARASMLDKQTEEIEKKEKRQWQKNQ